MCVNKMDLKSKGGTTYDNFSSQMMWMVMDVGIDGNGRDGGVEKRRYSSNVFSFFSLLLFLSFSFFFSFLFPCLFSFSLLFAFVTYFKISKEFTQNKDMEELFRGGLKRVCQSVKCNV